jgi:AcrR family transcriptional regulator
MPKAGEPAPRPRGRPRKTAAEQADGNRRADLLRSAAKLFRRKGFHATSTRDIADSVGMRSGSPFYHFESKGALLFAVMEEGMRSAIAQQRAVVAACKAADARSRLRTLVRNHFDVLLGPGSDFVPVMLYEARAINPRQRAAIVQLQSEYEAEWLPVLHALHREGRLQADVKLARLLIFGALNWSVQWYDRRQAAGLDELTNAALKLFVKDAP